MNASQVEEEPELRDQVTAILARCKDDRHDLIPTLQTIQSELGYLPPVAVREVASHLGLTDVQVYGVASFYNYFRFTPLGKHPVQMCMGTACHMVGGELVLEALERALDVDVGGITEDKEFSLDRVACVGCCGLAPVVLIGDKIHAKMSPTKVDEVLVNLKMEDQQATDVTEDRPETESE
jgi:NADH-quinone oxidoreductase subunit E